MDALPVLKALGDDTRFGIYRELTLSPTPLSASEMAERVGLHANTVRPHLEGKTFRKVVFVPGRLLNVVV